MLEIQKDCSKNRPFNITKNKNGVYVPAEIDKQVKKKINQNRKQS